MPLHWTPELVARFWDYESSRHGHYFAEQYGAAIVASFGDLLPAGATVVDYGCGAGGLLPHLLERAGAVWGIDHSPASRAEVGKRFGGHPRFAGTLAPDATAPLAGKADALFCVEVIEHLDDAALASLLERIRALLKPGGIAIFTTPNAEPLDKSEVFCPSCEQVFHRWQHVRSWERASLAALLERNGFAVARTLETDFRAHRLVNRRRWLRRRLRDWLRGLRGASGSRHAGRRSSSTPHLACAARRGAS